MITLLLLAALAQERDVPRRPPQDDVRHEADELRARLEHTDDPEERQRLMDQLARLEPDRRRISEEEFARIEKEMLAFFKEHDLDFGDLKTSKPEEYREILIGAWHMSRGREHPDPEWRELQEDLMVAEVRIQLLSSTYRREEGHGSAEIEKKIHAAVDELFDLRVKLREMEIAELEARMEEIRARLEEQKANKERLVKERVKELTGKRRDLEFP